LDDVLPKLNGAKYFSIVDARSGYWNIKLDHASSLYTTFNSPHGRYRFLQLPFGLICAQDIFQKKVDETFGDLPGVTGIADDIIIYGCDLADHDANLKVVMECAGETSFRFNADKCKIRCTEIPFLATSSAQTASDQTHRRWKQLATWTPPQVLLTYKPFLA